MLWRSVQKKSFVSPSNWGKWFVLLGALHQYHHTDLMVFFCPRIHCLYWFLGSFGLWVSWLKQQRFCEVDECRLHASVNGVCHIYRDLWLADLGNAITLFPCCMREWSQKYNGNNEGSRSFYTSNLQSIIDWNYSEGSFLTASMVQTESRKYQVLPSFSFICFLPCKSWQDGGGTTWSEMARLPSSVANR